MASLLPVPGNLVIVVLLAPLIALAMLRNVAALAPYSLGADIAMISGAAAFLTSCGLLRRHAAYLLVMVLYHYQHDTTTLCCY